MAGEDVPISLAELFDRPAWMRDGLCREPAYADVDFFLERGGDSRPAKALCARCLVQPECLAYALDRPMWDDSGIWGGTSARERRRLRSTSAGGAEAA
jgi:WhiB family redox-sensing transcriptional regulator